MEFNEKLMTLRKQNGLSQEELAERLGVSRQAISKWETKAAMPDIDKVLQLSRVFAISTDDLLHDGLIESEHGGDNDAENDRKKHEQKRTFWKQFCIALVAVGTVMLLYGLYETAYWTPLFGVMIQILAVGIFEPICVWDKEVTHPKQERWSFYNITSWMLVIAPVNLINYFLIPILLNDILHVSSAISFWIARLSTYAVISIAVYYSLKRRCK